LVSRQLNHLNKNQKKQIRKVLKNKLKVSAFD
jgi:hypothetical protein